MLIQSYLDKYKMRLLGRHINYLQQILFILNQFKWFFEQVNTNVCMWRMGKDSNNSELECHQSE